MKLTVTETTTYSGANGDGNEAENSRREAKPLHPGLGGLVLHLVWKAEKLRALKEEMDVEEAHEKAREEMPPGSPTDRSIYIDFSSSIPESQIDRIINLEREWWGVTLIKQKYGEPSTWAAQWVFVVDGTDWGTFMRNLKAAKGIKLKGTKRGYHVGEPYPYHYEGEEPTYRGYSYINWGACVGAAEAAVSYKGDPNGFFPILIRDKPSWAFLKGEGMLAVAKSTAEEIWQDAPEKIAAWIINHELSHGIYRIEDDVKAHAAMPFEGEIPGLEILLYYTDTGIRHLNKTLGEKPGKDPNLFLDYTGGWRIERKTK